MMLHVFIYILAVCYCVHTKELPEYIMNERCSLSSPTLAHCIEESGNRVITRVAEEGLPEFDIPPMQPLQLNDIVIRNDSTFRFILKNVSVSGLNGSRMSNTTASLVDRILTYDLLIPLLEITGEYEMDGHITDLPVKGKGSALIRLVNGTYHHETLFSIDEDNFAKNISININYTTATHQYSFSGLSVDSATNNYINSHLQEMSALLKPGARKVMNSFVLSIYRKIDDFIPLTVSYLP